MNDFTLSMNRQNYDLKTDVAQRRAICWYHRNTAHRLHVPTTHNGDTFFFLDADECFAIDFF